MPSLDAAALAQLGPYLNLATALGKVLAKLGPASPDSLRVSYHGALAEQDTGLVSRHVLTALLSAACYEGQVNIVKAPAVAKSMGLDLTESTISAATEFSELLVAELTKGDAKFRLAGTIIGRTPRIVEIDRTFVDTNIEGHFMIVSNDDRPGIVGAIGSTIGEAEVNIANMSLARNKQDGSALTIIEIDQPLAPEVMDTLREVGGILSVTGVTL